MGVNFGGGGKGGVPQSLLDLLHGDALTEQQAGAGHGTGCAAGCVASAGV